MDLWGEFESDEALETEGVWQSLSDEAKIKVARIGNPKFQAALDDGMRPYKRMVRQGTIPDDTQKTILIEALARGVLLDWDGLTKDGEPFPYSHENAVAALTDLKDFCEVVVDLARNAEIFRAEDQDDAAKN